MKTLEIDVDRVESRVCLKDTVAKDIKFKYFFNYNNTIEEILKLCDKWIDKYGVDEVDVIGTGVGRIAYDILDAKRHTAEGFARYNLNLYTGGKLA